MRQEVIFYDYEFGLLGRSANMTDIYHKELYRGIGSFEAGMAADDPMADVLLGRDYTVAIWGDMQAIITSVQANDDEGVLRIYGRTPNWLLAKRACPNFGQRTGTPFELVHTLVDEVWGDSIAVGEGRDIEAEETTFWRNVYNPLNEVVEDCLERADGGYRVVYDREKRQWRFETYAGAETDFLFSEDRHNIYGVTLRRSVLDYVNGGYYLIDDDEGTWGEIESDKEGIYRWTSRLDASGESSAKSDLAKRRIENEIDFEIIGGSARYSLGDLVRVERRRGSSRRTVKMRVAATERWAEQGSCGERPLLESVSE